MIKPKDILISAYALPGLKGNYKFPVYMQSGHKADYIDKIVSEYFGEKMLTIRGKRRDRNIVSARHIIVFLLRRYTDLTLMAIGKRYNRDHTTIMNSIRVIKNLMETDPVMMHIVQSLEARVQ